MPSSHSLPSTFKSLLVLVSFLVFLPLLSTPTFSQENTESDPVLFKPNMFHGGLGFGGVIFTATTNYERILTQHLDKVVTATFAKIGIGAYLSWGGDGQYIFAQYGFMTGKKANHFEASAGPNFILGDDDLLPVAFNFGYRHQKPGKSFMYRTGIGFPEIIYFGMGLSF
jgi:hypothetical protein